MSQLLAIDVPPQASSAFLWAWGAASLLLATSLGFLAGKIYENRSSDRSLKQVPDSPQSLKDLMLETCDKAEHLTNLLAQMPQTDLSSEDVDRLDGRRRSLLNTLEAFITRQRESLARKSEATAKPKPQAFRIDWRRTPVDSTTNLPDRAALDANLITMLEAGAKAHAPSGLLLVKIDRLEQLEARFGILGTDRVVKSMAAVISSGVREQDLVCRTAVDTFGILIPSVDSEDARKLSQAVRNSVRVHSFRLQENGPEVMVTASFGLTTCQPHDTPELIYMQAGDALAQSIRLGRNQLHVFDGESVVRCLAG